MFEPIPLLPVILIAGGVFAVGLALHWAFSQLGIPRSMRSDALGLLVIVGLLAFWAQGRPLPAAENAPPAWPIYLPYVGK